MDLWLTRFGFSLLQACRVVLHPKHILIVGQRLIEPEFLTWFQNRGGSGIPPLVDFGMAIREGKAAQVAKIAGSLREGGKALGASRFSELCENLEGLSRQGALDAGLAVLKDLRNECAQVLSGPLPAA